MIKPQDRKSSITASNYTAEHATYAMFDDRAALVWDNTDREAIT